MNMSKWFFIAAVVCFILPVLAFAAKSKDYAVGAYYYPWYTDDNFHNDWLTLKDIADTWLDCGMANPNNYWQ